MQKLYGPYIADINSSGEKILRYQGNARMEQIADIGSIKFDEMVLNNRLDAIVNDDAYQHIHQIDSAIFFATVFYFKGIGAEWCNSPLTTLMISSPGEIYTGKTLDYTTDALPIELSWFDNERNIFLSESSQFYLELHLLIEKVNKVFTICNSFRKEKADATHLSEFQHIEFEGKVSFEQNIEVFLGLLRHITNHLVQNNRDNLAYFLEPSDLETLKNAFVDSSIRSLSFKEALRMLSEATGDHQYDDFTLKHFGAWEEVKLTEILGTHALLTDFPLLEIPFYHNQRSSEGKLVAENADLILYGYRETVGSGVRITDPQILAEKARQFNLPEADYAPYLKTRSYSQYQQTAGFGFGWQRYVQWLLKLPIIWDATLIPRGHLLPRP
jgi:aspartyl/asparaginyl-tRNA synthetase